MIVFPNAAANDCALHFTHNLQACYHLYVTSLTIGPDTVIRDFTEASWVGYAPLVVPRWYVLGPPLPYGQATADPLVWTLPATAGAVQVYGYYVTEMQPGPLLWAEASPGTGPILVESGDCITIYPTITWPASEPDARSAADAARRRPVGARRRV